MTATLPDDARALFQARNFAHVTSLMPDGSPQASPVWCEAVGNDVVINVDASTIKARNFRRDPRVAVSIVDQERPYEAVFIRGRVTDIRPDSEGKHIDALARKYLGLDEYPFHQPGEERLTVVITPDTLGSLHSPLTDR